MSFLTVVPGVLAAHYAPLAPKDDTALAPDALFKPNDYGQYWCSWLMGC